MRARVGDNENFMAQLSLELIFSLVTDESPGRNKIVINLGKLPKIN